MWASIAAAAPSVVHQPNTIVVTCTGQRVCHSMRWDIITASIALLHLTASGGVPCHLLSLLTPLSLSHTWSKIEICSECFSVFSAEQDRGRRRKKKRKMEKNVVNVTEPWKAWPGVGMTRYIRFFSAVAAGINITYISPSLVQEISSPGTYNLNTLTTLCFAHTYTHYT